jgi:ParB family chromosome partitioning protein
LEALLGRLTPVTAPVEGSPVAVSADALEVPLSHQAAPKAQALVNGEVTVAEAPSNRVAIALIDSNPHQPRKQFDEAEMTALSESIQAHGLLQPVVVRRVGERYQLVAGERRLRAAAKAGWHDVPVQVVEADDRQMAELAIVENLQRKDLNALEKAASFQRYLEEYQSTQEELASRLKIDRSTIANLIRLLELPETVQDSLRRGKITQGHARALLPLGDEREQIAFSQRIQREGLSVRQTEAMVQETIDQADREPLAFPGREPEKAKPKRAQNEHVAALEQEFRAALGMKVGLRHNARGRGKLVIQFRNHDEFERLRDLLCGPRPKARAG